MEGGAKQETPPAKNTKNRGTRPPRTRKRFIDNQNNKNVDTSLKVHVTGFAPFTQEEDLKCIFSKNDIEVSVDNMTKQIATLVFTTKEDAKAALEKSDKINLYGSFLTVKPFNPADEPAYDMRNHKNYNRMEFPLTKQKGVIIDPKQIDLSGQFCEQLDQILASVRLTQEEVEKIRQLYADLEYVLQEQWPGCVALPFGSITTGLGMKTSDADCFINVPAEFKTHYNHDYFIPRTKRLLQSDPETFAEILCIPRANTPIVKFFHVPTETNCDVTFKTLLGVQNSKLIGFLLHADPRILSVSVVIRYWAKVHELSGSGKLTNYALTLLIIFYLQQPPLSILPSVEWLQRDRSNDLLVDYWNTGFMQDYNCLPPSTNNASLSEILGGFFEFYSVFNFEETVVCPYLGSPVKKNVFKDIDSLPQEFALYSQNVRERLVMPMKFTTSICVQDPLEQSHNVASGISSRLAAQIKAFFKFAANAYEKDKVNNCSEFLKIILLMKPKITRARNHPEFRVNLLPKMVANITNPEWKAEVREVVLTIFEKILKIKLGKMEEKMTPNAGKEKEKYVGSTARAVWKRKQFSKIYTFIKMGFVEKETRITEEILNTDKQAIHFQFNMTITYCHDPKSAVITIKMVIGSQDTFRDFGRFFTTVLPNWFMKLMKAFAKGENNLIKGNADVADTLENDLDAINTIDTDD